MAAIDWVTVLLGAGATGFLTAAYKAYRDWRESSWTRRDSAVADLERWREHSDNAREWEALQHDFWRDYAARCVYLIETKLGHDAVPTPPPYPRKPGREREEAYHDGPDGDI